MPSLICELWKNETLPARSGLYFANGRSIDLEIKHYPQPTVDIRGDFDFNGFYFENRDEITHITSLKKIELHEGGTLKVGGAAHGSEGFVSRLDADDDLIWVVYGEESNPFIDAFETEDGFIMAKSNLGFFLKIALDDPAKITVVDGDSL